ncbi:ADP-ribosylglycohydrolase family protein [Pseudoruminococcus massiliensis]|uniref:ADP-ribosylglycohydrolase family protein n=1 Tax=Pseudoruminococcus massiliensis TaxID=2086583 RepID=UPI00205DAE78|nr:MAG TPA: ADP-ribosylglycohydrolase [Caudoviricetes sp.]
MRNIDKFRGCLIGGAAGDALGYAVEFKREDEIFSEYGKKGITEYDLILDTDFAEISDDTQMTLFTAEGLLLAGRKGNSVDYINSIREMYKCWYQTQIEKYPQKNENLQCRLLNVSELYNRRCPGMTCMSAIREGAKGTIENPINDSKGCGGVMRVAPVGLYFCNTPISYEQSDMIGAEASALTHGHTLGFIPATALVHIVRAVTESDIPLKDAVNDSIVTIEKLFLNAKHIAEFTSIMQKAVQLAESAADDLTVIHQLGEGWVAEETLAIAVYCALKYDKDFDKALIASVNHNGDSDSTGAVCGNILGAYLGYNAIPQKYKKHLELHDLIVEVADNLHNGKETI